MLDVPIEIQELFTKDSISKNFRVHFPDGEYRDLVNSDIVSESVTFTESAMSSSDFRLGLCESGSIQFSTYFSNNIKGLVIFCAIEIDISSLDSDIQTQYGLTSSDVPYRFYRVPYGYFVVDSYKQTNNYYTVIAYNNKDYKGKTSRVLKTPYAISRLLKWGKRLDSIPENGFDDFQRIFMSQVVQSCVVNPIDGPTSKVSYGHNSPIFKWEKSYFSMSNISDSLFHNLCNPTIEVITRDHSHSDGTSRIYLYAKGWHIYFKADGNNIATFNTKPVIFSAYTSSNVELNGSKGKDLLTLPYEIFPDTSYITNQDESRASFHLQWKNTVDISSAITSIFNRIVSVLGSDRKTIEEKYNLSETDILNLITPSIKMIDVSTWPYGINRSQSDLPEPIIDFPAHFMTNNVDRGDNHINPTARLIHIPDVKIGDMSYLTVPDVRGYFMSYGNHREYLGNGSTYEDCANMLAICIPTEINVIPVYQVEYTYPPYDAFSSAYSTIVPVNSFTEQQFYILYDKMMQNYYPQYGTDSDNPCLELQFPLYPCKNENGDFVENVYDMNENVIDTKYVYNTNQSKDKENTSYAAIKDLESQNSATNILRSFAEFLGAYLLYDRINPFTLKLVQVQILEPLYPSDTLYPSTELYPSGAEIVLNRSIWRKCVIGLEKNVPYHNLKYNHVEFEILQGSPYIVRYKSYESFIPLNESIVENTYDITDNWIVNYYGLRFAYNIPHGIRDDEVALQNLISVIKEIIYDFVSVEIRGLPFIEALDPIHISTKNNGATAYVFRHRISGVQSLIDTIENN